jgi:hypothetical protein
VTAWKTIVGTDAVFDETTNTWVSKAEVAETVFAAFSSRKRVSRSPAGGSCAASRN